MINMENKTTLWNEHKLLGAKFTNFAGYDMPINYGSQLNEHQAVREAVGLFDVSHMAVIDIRGDEAQKFLEYLLANDITKISIHKSLYTCLCNFQGGIIDDLIVYQMADRYRIVVNAANKEKDLKWLKECSLNYKVTITHQSEYAILSLQGPQAWEKIHDLLPLNLKDDAQNLNHFENCYDAETSWFISKTGYTGENGFEIILPNRDVVELWKNLIANGVTPCGLGARDTLRLEAGMALYGQDMDDSISPFESGLGWTVALAPESRQFIGREKLEELQRIQKGAESKIQMIGLILEDRGVLRAGQNVILPNTGEGVITSGTFSPTLQCGIAMARVSANSNLASLKTCEVIIRNKIHHAKIVKYPFVRHNKAVYKPY